MTPFRAAIGLSPPGVSWLKASMANPLSCWNDGAARTAIVDFVGRVTRKGSDFVPEAERVAAFDNDGTLWCEKPMPVELGFILQQFAAAAAKDASLRERHPWKAALEKDFKWLGDAITKHYQGDDSDVKVLIGGILKTFGGMSVDDYCSAAAAFLQTAPHPTLKRKLRDCGYAPMVELLRYLEANGFTTYIASGGDRDFMRAVTDDIYQIPPERVIGSSNALKYQEGDRGGAVVYAAQPDVFDDGPAKPVRIWSRIGRRPIFAAGNSNGDIQMLQYAGGVNRLAFRLLVLHDDKEREFDYVGGAEQSLELAKTGGWTVVSIKRDWATVFAS